MSEMFPPPDGTAIDFIELGPKPSYLEASLSIRFDECNIASAEANMLARNLLDSDAKPAAFFVVEAVQNPQLTQIDRVRNISEIAFESTLTTQTIAMLALDAASNGLDGLLRPRLLAIFNNDIALPIASFERRSGGQCSFVQLGQEMEIDDLVVTSQDLRSEYVEAIRDVFKGRLTDKRIPLLTDLVNQEATKYSTSIELLLDPSFARMAHTIFSTTDFSRKNGDYTGAVKTVKKLFILGKPYDEPLKQNMEVVSIAGALLPGGEDEDRRVEMVLARETKTTLTQTSGFLKRKKTETVKTYGNLQLLALTRDDLAIPLVEFSRLGTGVITGGTAKNLEPNLTSADTGLLVLLRAFIESEVIDSDRSLKLGLMVHELGYEVYRKRVYSKHTKEQIDYIEELELQIIEGKKKYDKLMNDSISYRAQIDQDFAVSQRFDGTLGTYNPLIERLLMKLSIMATDTDQPEGFNVTLHEQTLGKTKSDVDMEAHITRVGAHTLRFIISGRPSAQTDDEMEPFFQEQLYWAQPNVLPEDKTLEILNRLNALTAGIKK